MKRRLIDANAFRMELERIALESDYIQDQLRQAFKALDAQPTVEPKHPENISPSCATCGVVEKLTEELEELKAVDELRIAKNFLQMMPKAYAKRTMNCTIIHDILMAGTSTAGMTSCCEKCKELGIDPHGYGLEPEVQE